MLNPPNLRGDTRQNLSAMMDSELEPAGLAPLVRAWQADDDSRATWHCYHLIGDVMRSDELARPAPRDSAMLLALRARLAQEPVPLAPRALHGAVPDSATAAHAGAAAPGRAAVGAGAGSGAGTGTWGRLRMPATALAAGFVVVAGVLVVLRQAAPPAADGATLAQAGAPVQAVVNTQSGALVRNAGLDRYLEAHRTLGSSVASAGAAEHRVQIVYESK